jgi:two-component system sensor histidine kinase HydH
VDTLVEDALGRNASQLAAAEKQRLLSRLLARLAHEIRNPLGSLDVHVQLLEEDLAQVTPPLSSKITGRLGIIRTELRRLDNIVRQYLNLAGPSSLNLESVNVADALQHVCSLLGPDAAAREIELVVTRTDSLPPLWADAGQLSQALVNLVINAIQAVEHRGRVGILARLDESSTGICIEVRDSGRGVDPEKRLVIFEPFFTTKSEGSGLGLWIVQQIALAHGGTIAAANGPDGGAVFTLRLPLRPRETPA